MDLNLIRSIVTVLAFGAFVLIVVRVWRATNRERYAEAAALPFADEQEPPSPRHPGESRDPTQSKGVLGAVDPGFRRDDERMDMATRWKQRGTNQNNAQ
jgi:cytochrome c oxidase cbb3-type subunit IV